MGDTGQLTGSAAEVYDEFFVPALFGAWPPRVVDAARIGPGMRVVDVACGTGVLALEAEARVGPAGSVVGIDLNPGMLAVARHKSRRIDDAQFERFAAAAEVELARFLLADGTVRFRHPALILTATKS
jgi:ubiquinone/menaquinone biosynthesis C-methylase UbiE